MEEKKDPQLMRYTFRRTLEEIAECEGRGTELITLYVPEGRSIPDVVNYLKNEYAQASNIKSRVTRNNVMGTLESLMNKVRQFKQPPPHGVAFFVGAKAIGADKTKDVSYVIEPPEPLNTYMYRCDSHFILDPLLSMIHEPELWGLIVIDRKEVTMGWLRGKAIQVLRNKESQVPSKHGMGGQSAHRFERLIEHAAHDFFVRCGDMATELFLPHKDDIKGILVGGPGATKDFFIKENFLQYELQKKVVEPLFDVGYTNEYGLRELVTKASNTLHGLEITEEKKLIQRLLTEVKKSNNPLATYGEGPTVKALDAGAVELLLVSEGLKNKDLVESLFKGASEHGATVRMISTESEEGEMLVKAFGGLAAILRYPFQSMV